jgi:hypothetical protein
MLSSRTLIQATRAAAQRAPFTARSIAGASFRTYATQSNPADSKPPVALYGLDGTYASALVRWAPIFHLQARSGLTTASTMRKHNRHTY